MVAEKGMNSESPSRQVTVVDVYDLASNIGKDFERLIDKVGADSVTTLMQKVISSLELLEVFASRNERENEEILGLKSIIERLEAEKQEKREGRQKFERELEQFEENYKAEVKQLWDMVQHLQDENKRLNNSLQQQEQLSPTYAIKEDDLKMMLTLQETVDHQRDQMKLCNKENDERQMEIESLHQQVDKLQRVNQELVRKNKAIQNQSRALVEEKADLISLLQDRDHSLEQLKLKLGETERARKDLEQSKVEESQNLDRDNVPRFTLAELREVLQEKNQLKARVMELEEELAQLRPVPTPSPQPLEKADEEEILVYGPINREPDEKMNPWKNQKESGVRKFFSRMWPRMGNSRSSQSIAILATTDTSRRTSIAGSQQERSASPLTNLFPRTNDHSTANGRTLPELPTDYDDMTLNFNVGLDL